MRLPKSALAAMAFLLVSSCSSKPSNSSTGCRLDSDCAPGSICKAHKCAPGCKTPDGCPTGQSCIAGMCSAGGADAGVDANGNGGAGATGGAGGTGGGVSASQLGAVCSSDSDCGPDLFCALPTGHDFGLSGPSRGYCTAHCSLDYDCSALMPGSQCSGFNFSTSCLRPCDPSAKDPCFGRYDVQCEPDAAADGTIVGDVCFPRCATDFDCAGLKCDLLTGMCVDTPNPGDPVGTPCDPIAPTDPCAGFCQAYVGADPTLGSCSAKCNLLSFGIFGACGSNPDQHTPQAAACVYEATFSDGTVGGTCGRLCNCDSDCQAAGMVCGSWAQLGLSSPGQYTAKFGKEGYCIVPSWVTDGGPPGIPTCSQDAGADAQ